MFLFSWYHLNFLEVFYLFLCVVLHVFVNRIVSLTKVQFLFLTLSNIWSILERALIYGPYWKELSDECMSFHAVMLITCNHVFPLPPNICIHNWCPVSEGHRLTIIAHTAPLTSYLWQINMVLILHLTLKN